MALSRMRQENEEVLRNSLPYHWLKGLAQNEEEEARRRRHVAPPTPHPPPADGKGNGAEAIAPYAPSRHRHGEHLCYCPSPDCGYQMTVEEGQKCSLIECPLCGSRMRAVSTGEYRISQVEVVPIGPVLLTFGFLGLLAYLIKKRPFG